MATLVETLSSKLVVSPSLGVCRVLDFDKSGQFYLKSNAGIGAWRWVNEFAVLQIGDAVMYRNAADTLLLGLVTEIDLDTWEIGVIGEDGRTGYPHPQNVRCIVGRNMIVRQDEEEALSMGLLRVLARSIASFISKKGA